MSDLRILVTGSRAITDPTDVWPQLSHIVSMHVARHPQARITIVHGACPSGADELASQWVQKFNAANERQIVEERHPADWAGHGRAAGPIRNQAMVDLGADLCIAFPKGESRGTRHCMYRAIAAGIQTDVVELGD